MQDCFARRRQFSALISDFTATFVAKMQPGLFIMTKVCQCPSRKKKLEKAGMNSAKLEFIMTDNRQWEITLQNYSCVKGIYVNEDKMPKIKCKSRVCD